MKNVIVAWVTSDEKSFENHVPLLFVGQRNQRLGFHVKIHVLFLQGFEKLSSSYKQLLKDCGYLLHDVSHLYQEFFNQYTILTRFGDYETKCFLRWLVIQKYFSGEKIIHYDGDVVFNEDLAVIEQRVEGLTFILQGCPAFTVISDIQWFDQYTNELNDFTRNIEHYSAHAWTLRAGWQTTFDTRWSGSRFRPIISSDQDLLSHLMHTGAIHQSPVENIRKALDDYSIFQNPLLFHMYNHHIPYTYERINEIDYFSYVRADGPDQVYRKKVLLWHMQSCFTWYASKYIVRKKYLNLQPFTRLHYDPSGKVFEDYINKRIARFTHHTLRLNVYRYFFQKRDFSGLMSAGMWWKKGVFT